MKRQKIKGYQALVTRTRAAIDDEQQPTTGGAILSSSDRDTGIIPTVITTATAPPYATLDPPSVSSESAVVNWLRGFKDQSSSCPMSEISLLPINRILPEIHHFWQLLQRADLLQERARAENDFRLAAALIRSADERSTLASVISFLNN